LIGVTVGWTGIDLHHSGQDGLVFDVRVGDLVVILQVEVVLFYKGKELNRPVAEVIGIGNGAVLLTGAVILVTFVPRRKPVVVIVIVVQSKANLLQIVLAAGPVGGFPSLLDGWQQQRDEDTDDGNNHQQLNQREAGMPASDCGRGQFHGGPPGGKKGNGGLHRLN